MRNVIDYYKYWRTEAILADLDNKRNNFSVVCINLNGDFNIGSVIRNANAFLAKQVILVGNKRYDKRGTVGTHNYTQFKHVNRVESLEKFIDLENKESSKPIKIIGIDNVENALDVNTVDWNNINKYFHPIFIFGEEQLGIPDEVLKLCNNIVYIRQYGSVRSLNVGVASGIVMHEYVSNI